MRKWLGILLTAALAACGGEKKAPEVKVVSQISSNDFESLEGWIDGSPNSSLTTENAHSGTHSLVVKPGIDYSQSYINLLGRMSNARTQKIRVTAWVFVPSAAASAYLVVEINNPAGTPEKLVYQVVELAKEVKKYGEWQQIERVIDVPAAANANSQFKLYLWRTASNQPVYLDDLTLANAN